MKLLHHLTILAIILLFSQQSMAQSLVAGIIKFPAMSSNGVDGQLQIIPNQILLNTLDAAGLNYRAVSFPPKRLYHQLASGEVQIFVGVKDHPTYAGKVLYSKAVVRSLELNIYRWHNTKNLDRLALLFGQKLGLIKGFDYNGRRDQLLTPDNKAYIVDLVTHKSALNMLKNGRIHYLLDYKFAIDSVLAHYPMPALRSQHLHSTHLYFIVAQSTDNALSILQTLEQTYQQLSLSQQS